MSSLRNAFAKLQEQWQGYDASQDTTGDLYNRIRINLLELIETAREDMYREEYLRFKKDVIQYLCEICDSQRDKDLLKRFAAGILSPEELTFILANTTAKRS
ncbi:hypothetical protein [Parathalassolituus penaei]|uniref:Uncharacterized protein n=1 Tax=Parathalassolituus penaei TaxID=2997323 RepID=A0A9X3EEI3_9GAMM|nr:hypothetical protein [Parathalassolituus penaei]MCY0966089.1 hypothetical protein [Parathalassolituus penaei]